MDRDRAMDTQVVNETEGDQRGQQAPDPRGRGRRHRLRRPGTGPPAGAPSRTSRSPPPPVRRPPARRAACRRSRASGTARWCRSNAAAFAAPTSCSWRCPKPRRPSSRRCCSPRGLRVIDLSGAFRLRDDAARAKWYPATTALPDGVAYGLTEFELDAITPARAAVEPGLLPHGVAARPAAAAARRPAAAGRRHRHRRQVGHLGRRQGADRPHALLGEPRQRGRLQRRSATGTRRRWSRRSGAR